MTLASFNYNDERFADLQLLRYRLNGFEKLTLNQKRLVYFLVQATLLAGTSRLTNSENTTYVFAKHLR